MHIELLVLILSLAGTVSAAFFSYRDEKKRHRRVVQAIGAVSVSVVGLAGIELYFENQNISELKALAERSWNIVSASPIDHFEIEFLIADGLVEAGQFYKVLEQNSLQIKGLTLADTGSGTGQVQDTLFSLDDMLKPENLLKATRIGIGTATVEQNRWTDEVTDMHSFDCTASQPNVAQFAEQASNKLICSVTISVPVQKPITVADIGRLSKIVLSSPRSTPTIKCLGPCKKTYISVRAVTNYGPPHSLYSEAIELSPRSYLVSPNVIDGSTIQYALPGDALQKLAEQRFKDTYGYRDKEPFEFTLGLMVSIYQQLTTREVRGVILGEVWTTASSPSQEMLNSAVKASGTDLMQFHVREWCMFGGGETCWHVYAVMDTSVSAKPSSP